MKFATIAMLAAVVPAATAVAAPVTVDLRVEGRTSTLYEGRVTTDVAPFRFTAGADQADHTCDGTGSGGAASTPSPTRGAALAVAARTAPFAMEGTWNPSLGFSVSKIAGEDVSYDAATNSFLVEYKNGVAASVGACGDPITNGDDVVFAWGDGTQPVLHLSVPATAAPSQPVSATVTQEDTRAAVAGATVGGATTGSDGTASLTFTDRGPHVLKAQKAGAIRSNAATVCVTDGRDGFCNTTAPSATPTQCVTTGDDGLCGSPDHRPPAARLTGITEGKHYAKGKGPRQLAGHVADDPSGLAAVRLRLTRNDRTHCATYDGKSERWKTLHHCGARHGTWFSVGTSQDFTYLLPAKLPRGRYVLDLQAADKAGNRNAALARGTTRVVFTVA